MSSGEFPADRVYGAPGLLEEFERIGEAFQAGWEAQVPSNIRFRKRDIPNEPFTLASGATGEFRWQQNPKLYRPGLPEFGLGKNWLPSGGFNVSEMEDEERILYSYTFGRMIARNTHQSDSAIVMQDRYLEDPETGQQPLDRILFAAQRAELLRCAKYLGEIGRILAEKEWEDVKPANMIDSAEQEVEAAAVIPARASRFGGRLLGRRN